jgi:hypothetical protein
VKKYLVTEEWLDAVIDELPCDWGCDLVPGGPVEELPEGGKWLTREDVGKALEGLALTFLGVEFSCDEIDSTTGSWINQELDYIFGEEK